MSRLFGASSPDIRVAIGPSSTETWDPVTILAVVRRASDGSIHGILSMDTSGPSTVGHIGIMNNDNMLFNNQGSFFDSGGPSVVAADGWCLLAWSKPAGTTNVTYDKFVYATGAATRSVTGGSSPAQTPPGAGGFWRVGCNSFGESFNGHIAAIAVVRRVMTELEISAAVRGDWWRFSPTFWREFPNGRDVPALGRTLGRDATRDTQVTATGRATVTDPPGFRFSASSRRR